MNPELNLKTLPPDLYSRNLVISYLAKRILNKPQLRVLDVGGYGSELHKFLPADSKYYLLDRKGQPKTFQPTENVFYVQADAKKVPFSDKNFDVVIASDILEHVHADDRDKVIKELARVSKNLLIIGAPLKSTIVEKAESLIRDSFKANSGYKHPFLAEHEEIGLPEESELDELFANNSLNFMKVREGNLMNWYIQQLYVSSQQGEPSSTDFNFNEFFNEHISELGNLRPPTYRTIYCLAKNEDTFSEEEINDGLQQEHRWNATTFMELLDKAFQDLRHVIDQKKKLIGDFDTILGSKNQEIEAINVQHEKTISIARRSVEAHREAILELRKFLDERESALNVIKSLVHEKDAQIATLNNEKNNILEQKKNEINLINNELANLKEALLKLNIDLQASEQKNDWNKQQIVEKDSKIISLTEEMAAIQRDLVNHQIELQKVIKSRAWRTIMFYGRIKNILLKPFKLLWRGIRLLFIYGPSQFYKKLKTKMLSNKTNLATNPTVPYNIYRKENEITAEKKKVIKEKISKFDYLPVISVIMPVYNVDEKWLTKAIDSVRNQIYEKFELCICDDASTEPHIKPLLAKYEAMDKRIKVIHQQKNGGIVKATNAAIKMASGAYIAFMDNDDEISPNSLYEVALSLQDDHYDLIYSDEDKIDMEGNYCEPFFKPDWNPDLLLSINYINHLAVYRRKLVNELNGLRDGFDGSQDHDLLLRVTEKTDKIKHISKVLYHWRKIPGSTASDINAKPYCSESSKKALRDAAKRRNITADITDGIWQGSYNFKRSIKDTPLISVIIPFRDKVEVLKRCIDSIITRCNYKNIEIILVDNQSSDQDTKDYLKELQEKLANGFYPHDKIRLLQYNAPFNYSAINNYAVTESRGEYVLLLNNDTEVIASDFLEIMLSHAQRKEVGAVGAKLYFPNNTVQHAGIYFGVGGIANSAHYKILREDNGYFGLANVTQDLSAVTAACIMMKKELFLKIGGLDQKNLAVAFNDVDLCLRLREKGYLIVYTPYATLYHYESLSRGYNVSLQEVNYMQNKYSKLLKAGDPYYNVNLSREKLDFSLRVTDVVKK